MTGASLRQVLDGAATAAAVGALAFAGWLGRLPSAPERYRPSHLEPGETAAILEALRPPKRERPVIAVLGINDGTDTADYLMTIGILRRADLGDVLAVATAQGPIRMTPALTVLPDITTASFDVRYPGGADYVLVPAMQPDDDPAVLKWIRSQARIGATVVGICAGAMVVGNAGLLDSRRATTHWYYLPRLLKAHPEITYVPDRRIVVDGRVATTTGITAGIPFALALIEAVAGEGRSSSMARVLGARPWDARHDSSAFRLTRRFAITATRNRLAFWRREEVGIALTPGMDEIALALVAEAWSRTYRSHFRIFSATSGPVTTRSGLRVLPDVITNSWSGKVELPAPEGPALAVLDRSLDAISDRYGEHTATIVATQLEYARNVP